MQINAVQHFRTVHEENYLSELVEDRESPSELEDRQKAVVDQLTSQQDARHQLPLQEN